MNCIDEHYKDLLQAIIDYGVEKKDRTGTGTKSIFGYTIRHRMSDGFPILTTKKVSFKNIVVELLWFLRGDTNIKYLLDNGCNIWTGDAYKNYLKHYKVLAEDLNKWQKENMPPLTQEQFVDAIKTNDEFAKKWGDLGPIYGKQWRKWELPNYSIEHVEYGFDNNLHVDQIANLINDLKTNPDSRRLMVSAWNVGELDQMVLPPCHYGFQVYTRELSQGERFAILDNISIYNKRTVGIGNIDPLELNNIPTRAISLMWNQRSVDTFLGLPFNIASYGLLLEIIAKMVNMVPDQLIGNLGDVHLYNNHIEQAKEQIEREPFELPKLNINTEFWPYEGGECGVGPIDATAVLSSFKDNNFCKCLLNDDIQLSNYQSHPAIKAPLSN
jgi:thymidylate synthase